MKEEVKFYREKKTGEVVFAASGKAITSEDFVEIKANTVDAAVEKHVPVYEVEGNEIIVKVGSVSHPMTDEHYIMWIALVSDGKITVSKLAPNMEAQARFEYIKGSEIYAYCNLHSLWKTVVE